VRRSCYTPPTNETILKPEPPSIGRPGIRAGQRGQLQLVKDTQHPGFGVGQSLPGVLPFPEQQVDAFQCARAP